VQDDQLPFALINHVEQPQLILPTSISYPQSFAFCNGGLSCRLIPKRLEATFQAILKFGQTIVDAIFVQKISNFSEHVV
jgi:hypothetical protein